MASFPLKPIKDLFSSTGSADAPDHRSIPAGGLAVTPAEALEIQQRQSIRSMMGPLFSK